jgi:uroporphyrinogen-III decarboxylase
MQIEWKKMTTDEKLETMLKLWSAPPNVKFKDDRAKEAYKVRFDRLIDTVLLRKQPDRIPVVPMTGFFPAFNVGLTPYDVMYDYGKLKQAWTKYVFEYEPDAHGGAAMAVPGKMYDILDYKLYAWAGHGLPHTSAYQALEGEYMKADEYADLIDDPSDYFRRTYLPRAFGALQPFTSLTPLTNILEMYGGFAGFGILPYGIPPVQAAQKALMEAGSEALKWGTVMMEFDNEMAAAGFPNFFGGGTKAPFDILGDTLRGTRGIMLDLYRQPQKILEAVEALTPIGIKMGVSAARQNGNPVVFIPLHKGADGFLSEAQFRKYYWPSLLKLLEGLVKEGCIPFPWAEGSYNSRLEIIKESPQARVIWGFDATDMAKAKQILGDFCCITGNVPMSLLKIDSVKEVEVYVKHLIEVAGPGGGYIMMNGAVIDEANIANVKAMIDYSKQYGVYK